MFLFELSYYFILAQPDLFVKLPSATTLQAIRLAARLRVLMSRVVNH